MTEKKPENEYIAKTREGLSAQIDEVLLAPRGFDLRGIEASGKDCVLVMGLNPSGDASDARREEEDRTYLYSIDAAAGKPVSSKWFHNTYFRPLLGLVQAVVPNGAKWPWGAMDWETICRETTGTELEPSLSALKKEYIARSQNACTVFIGDMFYYHEKNSKKMPYRKDWSDEQYGKYCWEMLEKHVCELQAYEKDVRFVYINSAKVSHWLCPDPQKTNEFSVLGNSRVPIFYGAMLSSGNMDEYSVARLVNEIRNLVNPGKPY